MENDRIFQLADILMACHGADAEQIARKRGRRCLQRKELEWAQVWRDVAEYISKRSPQT